MKRVYDATRLFQFYLNYLSEISKSASPSIQNEPANPGPALENDTTMTSNGEDDDADNNANRSISSSTNIRGKSGVKEGDRIKKEKGKESSRKYRDKKRIMNLNLDKLLLNKINLNKDLQKKIKLLKDLNDHMRIFCIKEFLIEKTKNKLPVSLN